MMRAIAENTQMNKYTRNRACFPRGAAVRWLVAAAVATLLAGRVRAAPAAASGVEQLDTLVEQWVALRRQIAETQEEWRRQRSLLEDEQRLLERRRNNLRQELAETRTALEESRRQQTRARTERDRLRQNILQASDSLDKTRTALLEWRRYLPPFLEAPLAERFDELADMTGDPDPAALSEQAQTVLGLVSAVEQMHRSIHTGRMLLTPPDGAEREMQTLFLGLAAAFAVSPDGARAAAGSPVNGEWVWSWNAELAPAIRRALAVFRKDETAALVPLPLNIREDSP